MRAFDGRTGNTTRATITGCFHVLILKKNCRCQLFFPFLITFLIHISEWRRGGGVSVGLGRASGV